MMILFGVFFLLCVVYLACAGVEADQTDICLRAPEQHVGLWLPSWRQRREKETKKKFEMHTKAVQRRPQTTLQMCSLFKIPKPPTITPPPQPPHSPPLSETRMRTTTEESDTKKLQAACRSNLLSLSPPLFSVTYVPRASSGLHYLCVYCENVKTSPCAECVSDWWAEG